MLDHSPVPQSDQPGSPPGMTSPGHWMPARSFW